MELRQMGGRATGREMGDEDLPPCCCGAFPAKSGMRVMCIAEAVLLLLHFVHIVVFESIAGAQFTVQFCVGLFLICAWVGVVLCTWHAQATTNHYLLVPHMVASVLTIFAMFVAFLLYMVMVASEGQALAFLIGMEGNENNLPAIRVAVLSIGIIAMMVWAALIVMQIYCLCLLFTVYAHYRDIYEYFEGQPAAMFGMGYNKSMMAADRMMASAQSLSSGTTMPRDQQFIDIHPRSTDGRPTQF